MQEVSNNKRIAKNTLLLYFRMFVFISVNLYTSRVVLNTLGISDYGLYNVVGGIISMAGFLNAAMVSASQRFLSFELGKSDYEKLSRVFCTLVNIYILICIISLIVAETVGLWFVNTKLNIPEGRTVAANWVYQASLLAYVINMMSMPYNSAIVAREKMSVFAYISILDVVLKLLVVFLLPLILIDSLILYSILIVFVTILIRCIYTIYCKRNFQECTYRFVLDKQLFKDMFSFTGWSIIGGLGFSFKDQLSNILINIFYGTTVNAARGIGMQVTSQVKGFAQNFTMALNPQITKQYAAGNIEASRELVYAGSRYSFYLLTLISIPVIVNIDYILHVWLGVVPKYTSQFVIYSIIMSLIFSMSECVTKAIQATGNVKWLQIGVSIIMLSELPFAWILLKLGFPPYSVMWPSIGTYMFALIFRFWILRNYVDGYNFSDYFKKVVFRCIIVFCVAFTLSFSTCIRIQNEFFQLMLSIVSCLLITTITVCVFGISKNERKMFIKYVSTLINKFKRN